MVIPIAFQVANLLAAQTCLGQVVFLPWVLPLRSCIKFIKGRPILDLFHGSCDFCGQCVDNCPAGALNRDQGVKKQTMPWLAASCQLELGLYCNLCQEACPEQAIEYVDKKPVIDNDRCTGVVNVL